MHPADITAVLRKAGSSQAKIARELQITPTTVHQVVHDRARSLRVALKISEATKVPLSKLWPRAGYDRRLRQVA